MVAPFPPDPAVQDGEVPIIRFLVAGLVALVGGLALLPGIASLLSEGVVLTWPVLAALHLVGVGFLTMVAVGASLQLLPAALGAPIRFPVLARLSFWPLVAGVAGLVGSFAAGAPAGLAVAAPLVWLGLGLFLASVATSLRWKTLDLVGRHMAGAYIALLLAATLGGLMAFDLGGTFGGRLLANGPPAHAYMALFGWLLPLIVGVSYRLLPMFGLSHGHQQTTARVILAAGVPAWLVTAALLLAGSPWWQASALVSAAILVAYGWDIRKLWQRRMRRAPELAFRFVFTGLSLSLAACLAGLATVLVPGVPLPLERVLTACGVLLLVGGLTQTVLGYLHKIIPFLHWLRRYSAVAGQGNVPRMADLLRQGPSRWGFWFFQAGVAVLTVGIAAQAVVVATAGAVTLAVGGTLVAGNLLAVLHR